MNNVAYTNILKKFMETFGPSGYEKEVAYCFKTEIEKTADAVFIDKPGNVIAQYNGSDPESPVVMLFAHMDQLGFIVRKIEPDGYIQIERLGGIPEKVLPGLRVCIRTTNGNYVDGVIGVKSHHAASSEEKYKVDEIRSLFIDLGIKNDEEAARLGIAIGCPATYIPFFQRLQNDFVSGTALDNRGGLVSLIAAGNMFRSRPHASTVYIVGTVWEEYNLRGALMAARTCKPAVAIALDVVLAGDVPDLKNRFDTKCGGGPSVVLYNFHGRGTLNGVIAHPNLVALAEKCALDEKIPLQRFASLGILTDLSYIQLENDGIAVIDLGFPTRYTHTPIETASTNDIVNLGILAGAMTAGIDRRFSLYRY
jgi:putative aminopeptidase FrvX